MPFVNELWVGWWDIAQWIGSIFQLKWVARGCLINIKPNHCTTVFPPVARLTLSDVCAHVSGRVNKIVLLILQHRLLARRLSIKRRQVGCWIISEKTTTAFHHRYYWFAKTQNSQLIQLNFFAIDPLRVFRISRLVFNVFIDTFLISSAIASSVVRATRDVGKNYLLSLKIFPPIFPFTFPDLSLLITHDNSTFDSA